MRLLLWLLVPVLLCGHASAQQAPPGASERAKLNFLAGSFSTEVVMPPQPMAPHGATGKGTSVIGWGLDSMFLMIDEQSVNSLMGPYKGHGVLGFDAHAGQYQLFMFNNFGDHPVYQGTFSGDTLVLGTTVQMPGHPFDQKILWFRDGETVKLRVLTDAGKGFTVAVEQTATPVQRQGQ